MLEFDVADTYLYNIGINIFCIVVMALLYFSCRRGFSQTQDIIILCRIQLLIIVILVMDIIMWSTDGMEGKAAYITEYAVNMIYFTGQVLVVMDWVRYVVYRVYNKKLPEKVDMFGLVIPAVAIMVVIFTTPVTKLCFYVDSSNFYHRGSLCTVLALITMAYIIVASFIGLHRRSKEILSEKRRECLIISAFAIPPLIGGSAQVLTYGIALLWPTVVLSILMAFINMQNQAISQDALTGLNNRGNLDRYLNSVVDGSDRSVALIIADINNFKKINDSFGHDVGDDVLTYVSEILKKTFAGTPAFLARYGGDEFVIVMADEPAGSTEIMIRKIIDNVKMFNDTIDYGFELSLGIGYAKYPDQNITDVNSLLKAADTNMYVNKNMMKSKVKQEVAK